MKQSRWTALANALVIVALVGGAAFLFTRPRGDTISAVDFSLGTITPNADNDGDVTLISYHVKREATVSIAFENADGTRYVFRQPQIRVPGDYELYFGGVVDGFTLPGDVVNGTIKARLLPDGEYTWLVVAEDSKTGVEETHSGTLTINDGDSALPDLLEFSITPQVFTPNQDGLTDRVYINTYIPKEASLLVYLLDEADEKTYIPESQTDRAPGDEGRHLFEWDGGVELGREPPPDGTYSVMVEAKDAVGQIVTQSGVLTLENGGVPLAEIVSQPIGDTLSFSSDVVMQGDVLTFEITVWNYGEAPIRTTGPEPGHIYEQTEYFASSGYFLESGAWRLGIHCDTCVNDYPWRWAIGTEEELTPIEVEGVTHYYLMPGQRVVITGGIRLTVITEARNPQLFWAGLIHEDVGIANINNYVDPQWITIVPAEE